MQEEETETDTLEDDGPDFARAVVRVDHGVDKLVLVDPVADEEVDEAADHDAGGEHGVDEDDDEDEDVLRENEADLEDGGLVEEVTECARCPGEPADDTVPKIEQQVAELEELERQDGEAVKHDQVDVKQRETLDGLGQQGGDLGCV